MKSCSWLVLLNECALSTLAASLVQASALLAAEISSDLVRNADDPFVAFKASFGSDMVLQQAPAKACVSGTVGNGGSAVTVTVATTPRVFYEVDANVSNGTSPGLFNWKACLEPAAAAAAAANASSYTITATCTQGCPQNTTAQIERVKFGEVWYCGGRTFLRAPSSTIWCPGLDPMLFCGFYFFALFLFLFDCAPCLTCWMYFRVEHGPSLDAHAFAERQS